MLTSTTNKVQYTINYPFGNTFQVTFKYWLAAEIHAVLSFPVATGKADLPLVLNTDFSLTAPGDTGTLTRLNDWDHDAIRLTIYRLLEIDQQTDYRNGEAVDMDLLEQDFDRATARMQQIDERIARTLQGSITDEEPLSEIPEATVRASQFLGFDAEGDVLVGQPVGVPATTWAQTLLDDLNLSAAQTTLGISAFIKTLLDDPTAPAAQTTLGIGSLLAALIASNWTIRTSAADNGWISVAYGNGLFVAVASTGAANRVMTSPDGITWTIRTSAEDNNWRGVAYGNDVFVAVAVSGTGNRVMTSPDGITWTIRTSAADNDWTSVAYGNGLFVAVASTGAANRVMTSPDGIAWTIRTSAADNEWYAVTYGNGLFVAVATTGTANRVMNSLRYPL